MPRKEICICNCDKAEREFDPLPDGWIEISLSGIKRAKNATGITNQKINHQQLLFHDKDALLKWITKNL